VGDLQRIGDGLDRQAFETDGDDGVGDGAIAGDPAATTGSLGRWKVGARRRDVERIGRVDGLEGRAGAAARLSDDLSPC
jgi:hypothetical protein